MVVQPSSGYSSDYLLSRFSVEINTYIFPEIFMFEILYKDLLLNSFLFSTKVNCLILQEGKAFLKRGHAKKAA